MNLRTTVVGLDADDTLWHSENRFQETHQRFHEIVAPHARLDVEQLEAQMLETETRNLRLFGYGAKGFTLSLIETAIEVTDHRIPTRSIEAILRLGHELLDHPVELLPGVQETVEELRASGRRLVIITKGDLWHQESKIAASGLADRVDGVEIVAEKDPGTYARILARHDVTPESFCMVGNSVRSDILPVRKLGARAIHVPYEYLWAHEHVAEAQVDWMAAESIGEIVELLD